jgi:hypothetical protein
MQEEKEMTGSIIILEGADAAGKTTLAGCIAEAVMLKGGDFLYLHGSPWPSTVVVEHTRMERQAIEAADNGATVVLDHFWIAEQLYGAEYRGAPAYNPGAVDTFMRSRGALLVLCVPSNLQAQVERHAARHAKGQEHFAHARGVIGRYAKLCVNDPYHEGDGYLDDLVRRGTLSMRSDAMRFDMNLTPAKTGASLAITKALALRKEAEERDGGLNRRHSTTVMPDEKTQLSYDVEGSMLKGSGR